MKKFTPVLLIILFFSCQQEINLERRADIKLNLFQVPMDLGTDRLIATINESKDVNIGFFGDGQNIHKLIFNDLENQQSTVMLLDDSGIPAFLYSYDPQNLRKENAIVEFEMIGSGQFFIRFYHYDWQNRIGTLLLESHIERQSGDWIADPTFVTSNLTLEGVNSRSNNKGASFKIPLTRFEKLQLRQNSNMGTQVSVEGFANFIDNFRQQDIPNFLKNKVLPIGDIATAVGVVGIAVVGSPAFVPILVGGVALSAGGRATSFFMSGGMDRLIDGLRNVQNVLTNGINNVGGSIVEVVSNLRSNTSQYWEQINSEFNDIDLDSFLNILRENEIIQDPEDLDDLPDNRGVVHVSLSWNTNETDIDLWVTDPHDERIFYDNPNSQSGGYLDRDNVTGFGPENIYWRNGAPDGTYSVSVHYYGCDFESSCPPTQYSVKISNGLGIVRTFSGSLAMEDQVDQVVTFRKSGTDLVF